jgi:hypothetical protein
MIWIWIGLACVVLLLLIVAAAWVLFFSRDSVREAIALFQLNRPSLEQRYFEAASATGKPRGLRWKAVEWTPGVEFGRELKTGRYAALVGITIQFEAIEGGDMEGVAAVSNLRNASAVFFYHQRQWHTTGMTIFNLNPDEALRHFKNQYEPVPVRGS